jgi:sigma-B regulation protein RsbU (phosphoserine phosphatase)
VSEVDTLKSKIAALQQLLEVFEQTTLDQSARLEEVIRDNELKSQQVLEAERERAVWAIERARALEQELEIARQIQTSILPRTMHVAGLDIAAHMLPADQVGGDYYDVIPKGDGCWIGIGDVTGHGLNAGLVMMMTQSIVAALATIDPTATPTRVLGALNSVLFENIRTRMLQDDHVTLTLLRYKPDGEVVFAGAHEDILVSRADGTCEVVSTPGPWVGAIKDISDVTRDSMFRLNDGDVMVLHTDGVTEARNARREEFGVGRLAEVLSRARGRPSAEISTSILHSVTKWSDRQRDDITLVVAKYQDRGFQTEVV